MNAIIDYSFEFRRFIYIYCFVIIGYSICMRGVTYMNSGMWLFSCYSNYTLILFKRNAVFMEIFSDSNEFVIIEYLFVAFQIIFRNKFNYFYTIYLLPFANFQQSNKLIEYFVTFMFILFLSAKDIESLWNIRNFSESISIPA